MDRSFEIRLIKDGDAEAVLDIYKPHITDSSVSFEYDVPSIGEYRNRIASYTLDFPWLVCTYDERIIGFAYASKHRDRTAYQWSAECSIYMHSDAHRKGIATILYESLFELLRLQGYFNVYAGVTLPNDKSEGFHRAVGFSEVGIYKNIGFKHGQWHDTIWFQKKLIKHISNPPLPKKLGEAFEDPHFHAVLHHANNLMAAIHSKRI